MSDEVIRFAVNVYETDELIGECPCPNLLSQTDQTQAENIRDILQRFAIAGTVSGRDPSRDSFIGEMSEDEDIRSDKVNDMLDTPDLSFMDEMEIADFIRDNISVTNKTDKSDDPPKKSEDPPKKSEDPPTQEEPVDV